MPGSVPQRFYTRFAALYDAVFADVPGVGRIRRHAVAAMGLAPGDTVVDAGCGTGANLSYLRDAVGPEGTVVGVDFSAGMLARAEQRAAAWENVHVVAADATRVPVAPGQADAVFGSFVAGMLSDPADVVESWARFVGPGGSLGLLDLARSTGRGRPLNPLFGLAVRATSPPGTASSPGESPAGILDRRVAAAHRTLLDRCEAGERTHESSVLGFVRTSAGRVTATDE